MVKDQVRIIIDFETTGLNHKRDKIIQFAALKTLNGELIDELNLFISPGSIPISKGAYQSHGISSTDLLDKPLFCEVKSQIDEFFGKAMVLIAHNAQFEGNFLIGHGFSRNRFRFIDTLAIARRTLTKDQVPNHKLPTICRYYKINVDFHDALHDCVALFELSKIWRLI